MIKKDVVFQSDFVVEEINQTSLDNGPSDDSDMPLSDIDSVFAAADEAMQKQNSSLIANPKKKKKRKKHNFVVAALLTFLAFAIIFGYGTYSLSEYMKHEYPKIKEAFLEQVGDAQQKLQNTDDSNLTVDEYYQKKLWLLFSVEEIGDMIQGLEDIKTFSNALINPDEEMLKLIPPEKLEEYQKLLDEYEKALQNESHEPPSNT